MQILRLIIRFIIIAIAIGLLVFLSISLFRLIPAGINQLASATVSLGQGTSLKTSVATTTETNTQKDATPAPITEDGLNGIYDSKGDIVILEGSQTKDSTSKTSTTSEKVPYYPTTRSNNTRSYTTYRTYTNYIPTPIRTGGKNLKVTFSSIGIIQNGNFVSTNTFNTSNTVSMRFMVLNEEDTETGPWAMRVEMPAALGADKVKVLTNLASIPGESSYTGEVRFDGIDLSQGSPVIRIYLDIYNQVAETNENDNTLALELRNVTNNTTYINNNSYNNCFNGVYYYNCNNYDSGWNTGNSGTTPNLYITSLEIGKYINGTFYAQTTFNYGERVVVRARVRNNGGYFNNSWLTRLNIYDANNFSRDISTGTESPLSSNTESTITYEVDNLTRGSNRLTFYLDTSNNVYESNENDNNSQITIQVY